VALVTLDIGRSVCWALVLAGGLTEVFDSTLPRYWAKALYALAAALPLLALLAPIWTSGEAQVTWLIDLQRWSGLLTSIGGLVLVEQFARNARTDLRWELRYLWLGIGILFSFDLASWSMALLLGDYLEAVGRVRIVVNIAVAPLLAVALRRLPGPIRSSLVKRGGTLLFNTTLVVAGGYVMLMAFASVLLRRGDTETRSLVEVLFVGASLVVLAVALFSSQVRAWSRVTLSKFLLPYRYDYRDVWLTLTRDLSESTDVPVRRRAAMSLAAFINSGRGRIWERDLDVYRPFERDLSRGQPASIDHDEFFEFLRRREWIYDATEWRDSGGAPAIGADGTATPPPPCDLVSDKQLWLIVPLLCNTEIVGFATLDLPIAPSRLGWEQLDLLRAAGRQIGSYLAFDRAASRLAEMHQFEALNRLSAFVMHDLRHLVAQLALIVDNAARHRRNPEFVDDAILTIESSVKRMTGLMDMLKSGAVAAPERRVEVTDLLKEVVSHDTDRLPRPVLTIDDGAMEVMANRERLGQALEHLIHNAQDATPPDGQVSVSAHKEARFCTIRIADTGCGMDAEFVRTRLFKAFDSTKEERGMGLGAYEARDIVRKHGGSITVESSPGQGTIFRVSLPLAPVVSLGE